jgi:hypothetical protein
MKHTLKIKPAIIPEKRHKIEALLAREGFDVCGGGTDADMSSCDISFSSETDYSENLQQASHRTAQTLR